MEDRRREAAAIAEREVAKVAQEREARNALIQKEREEKERQSRIPSMHVTLHLENERGYAPVHDMKIICGGDATEEEDECAEEIGEWAIEAMMVVARKWGFDTVTLTLAEGGWRQFPLRYGRQESGLLTFYHLIPPNALVDFETDSLSSTFSLVDEIARTAEGQLVMWHLLASQAFHNLKPRSSAKHTFWQRQRVR